MFFSWQAEIWNRRMTQEQQKSTDVETYKITKIKLINYYVIGISPESNPGN